MTTSNLHRNMYLVELPSSQSCRPTLQLLLVRIADHRHCTLAADRLMKLSKSWPLGAAAMDNSACEMLDTELIMAFPRSKILLHLHTSHGLLLTDMRDGPAASGLLQGRLAAGGQRAGTLVQC